MSVNIKMTSYVDAIREGFEYSMERDPKCFAIGQGLWSPWYAGNSMKDLDKKFGRHRVIDTPVSELATTGAAIGAALHGFHPIVVHPRMDFMLLAVDQIVNQAAKWRHMFGGKSSPTITIRAMINRGGEQGAQHSQALHAWFAHIPGLRVLMPSSPSDARDMLIASTKSSDPVVYIDDRWCYEQSEVLSPPSDLEICTIKPLVRRKGSDCTIVAAGYSVCLALEAAASLANENISCEVVDLRQINPFAPEVLINSVKKTGHVIALDGGWSTCGLSSEILASVFENISPNTMKRKPIRLTIPFAPAPTSSPLEAAYYPTSKTIADSIRNSII